MTHLYRPRDVSELMIVEVMLEREDVHYFVQNEHGAYSTTIGAEAMSMMVSEADAERARQVVRQCLERASQSTR